MGAGRHAGGLTTTASAGSSISMPMRSMPWRQGPVDQVANNWASRHAVRLGASAEQLELEITEVNTLARYAAVMSHLQKLPWARRVTLVGVSGPMLRFSLVSDVDRSQSQQLLQLDGKLEQQSQPVADAPPGVVPTTALRYRWRGG
jgi:hypothetical protein